jgi:integrase
VLHQGVEPPEAAPVGGGEVQRAAQLKAPRPAKPEIKPLSPDQARKLIETAYATGDRYAALYVLALHAGLRKGEMLGLRWDDLDLDAITPTLRVRSTLSETRTGHKFELPKSGKGRSIKLSRKAVEALKSHRARQAQDGERASRGGSLERSGSSPGRSGWTRWSW